MDKKELIKLTEDYLKNQGFTNEHYIMSLQGPTVILTIKGQQLMSFEIREKLTMAGFEILG